MTDAANVPPSHYEQTINAVIDTESNSWVKPSAFSFMRQLEGWCSEQKAGVMMDLILHTKPDVVVEIGVFGGKSLIPMACALKANQKGKVYGIDPWNSNTSVEFMTDEANKAWWGTLDHQAILDGLVQKVKKFDLTDQVELLITTSVDADPIPNIGLLHIDGNHCAETSYYDVTKWVPMVQSGGWIVLDDMEWFENGVNTTANAVEWLNTHCEKFAEYRADNVWGIWIQP